MADNAIDKLFEEMRAAKAAYDEAHRATIEARNAVSLADSNLGNAAHRIRLLQSTLDKHIHEGMPIVQAKMLAHDEQSAVTNRLAAEQTTIALRDSAITSRGSIISNTISASSSHATSHYRC